MIAHERIDGQQRSGRHSLSAVAPYRPSINVRIWPPEHLVRLQRLTLHQVPSSRSCSRRRDGYRFTCFVLRCRIRSPTTCICSTSSSVISTPANWSSIASINPTRSNKSAPRSFVKCASLVTNSMSTSELFGNESAEIVDGKTFLQRRRLLKRCQPTDGHAEAPRFGTCTPERANQCACKCDSD